jgi:hypothetical protein
VVFAAGFALAVGVGACGGGSDAGRAEEGAAEAGADVDSTFEIQPLPVTQVLMPERARRGESVPIRLIGMAPQTCWVLHRVRVEARGTEYRVRLLGRKARDLDCPDGMLPITAQTAVVLKEPGQYVFRFWISDELSVERKIVVW